MTASIKYFDDEFCCWEERQKGTLTVEGYGTSHPLNMKEDKYMGTNTNRLAYIVVGIWCGCDLTASICSSKY